MVSWHPFQLHKKYPKQEIVSVCDSYINSGKVKNPQRARNFLDDIIKEKSPILEYSPQKRTGWDSSPLNPQAWMNEDGIRLERRSMPKPRNKSMDKSDNEWTDKEIEAAVKTYLHMLNKEINQLPYRKRHIIIEVQKRYLDRRTLGSIEYRMQNISSVLDDLGFKWIEGYKPHKHIGDHVKQKIMNYLESEKFFSSSDLSPTESIEELDKRVCILMRAGLVKPPEGSNNPQRVENIVSQYKRDPAIKAWILRISNGICELCDKNAPFVNADNLPYLELHHIIPMSEGGPDTIGNAVILCPNCHRKLHFAVDRQQLRDALYKKIGRLVNNLNERLTITVG